MQCLQPTVPGLSLRVHMFMDHSINEEHSHHCPVPGHQINLLHGEPGWDLAHTVIRLGYKGSTEATEHLSPLYAVERHFKNPQVTLWHSCQQQISGFSVTAGG